ncbi:unnamed protein product, partial [Laminaria digitata]
MFCPMCAMLSARPPPAPFWFFRTSCRLCKLSRGRPTFPRRTFQAPRISPACPRPAKRTSRGSRLGWKLETSKTRRESASAFARSTSSAGSRGRTRQKRATQELPPSAPPPPSPPPLAVMPLMMMTAVTPTALTGLTSKAVTVTDRKGQMTAWMRRITAATTAVGFLVGRRRREEG